MAEEATKRYAVVTGANKGIGLETVRQLALNGFTVVLTARDEKRGLEALHKLKHPSVLFHQLDVANPASIACLADFIKSQFGKLDILVNNAGVGGVTLDADAVKAATSSLSEGGGIDWSKLRISAHGTEATSEAEECLNINFYGTKATSEALIPLLELSDSPRIVNVSASMGMLSYISSHEWAKGVLGDAETLTEERVDLVMSEFLKDFKEGSHEGKGWPSGMPAYAVSKAAVNAYTRILARKYSNFRVNSLCPGFVKTDINCNVGFLPVEEGAARVLKLALLPNDGPSGFFFVHNQVSDF